jgi:hypothetical protein
MLEMGTSGLMSGDENRDDVSASAPALVLDSTMPLPDRELGPQGLKPTFQAASSGTAEAVPYPKPIYETSNQF